MKKGLFVGLSTIDIVYRVEKFPSANSKVSALSQDVFVGGPATNASVAFSHLSGDSILITALGRNPLGRVIGDDLLRYSVHLIDLAPGFGGLPVVSSVAVSANGERCVISANGTRADVSPVQAEDRLLEQTSILLVDGHYMEVCRSWAAAAYDRGIEVVFDGGSWKEGTRELLQSVSTAICSADFRPPGCKTEDEAVSYLQDVGVAKIAITRGSQPVRFAAGVSTGILQVPQVQVVDTLGAGDIFHGAYCHYSSIGSGFVEALGQAAAIAADSCRFRGTREWMNYSFPQRTNSGTAIQSVEPHRRISAPANVHGGRDEQNQPHGVSPQDPWSRRTFLATAILGVGGLLMATPGFYEGFDEGKQKMLIEAARNEELRELLVCYLYPVNPGSNLQVSVPLVPAMQDPWGPKHRRFSGSGNDVARAYTLAFHPWNDKRIVQDIEVHPDATPVLIASHLVNQHAASYFGDPLSVHPLHALGYQDPWGGFKAHLRWTIYTPEDAKEVSRRELFEGSPTIRIEPAHRLSDLDNPKIRQPKFVHQGDLDYQEDDYLLITVLPRDSRFDRRVVSLAGLNKAGTLAAQRLLNDRDLALQILRQIHARVEGVPYYQALIALKVDYADGLPRPADLKLLDAEEIEGIDRMKA